MTNKTRHIIKFSIVILVSLIAAYCLYEAIGYLVRAFEYPHIYGEHGETSFTGNYMMVATYGGIFVVLVTLNIIFGVKFNPYKDEKNDSEQK